MKLQAVSTWMIVVCWAGVWSQLATAQTAPRPAPRAAQKPVLTEQGKSAQAPRTAVGAPPRAPQASPSGAVKSPSAQAASKAAAPSDAQAAMREVKVLVAGGNEYRSFYPDWQSRGRTIVDGASKHLEKHFGLRFKVVGFADWEYKTAPKTSDEAFRSLHKVPLGDADVAVGFTLVSFAGPRGEIRGLTQYFSQYVVIPDGWGVPGATTRLVHELSHVFGAFHVEERDSVMLPGFEKTPRTFKFGRAAEGVLPLTRNVNLQEGVGSLSAESQQSLRAIYRQYHHPSEAIEEDPIVVGYRYQALRAEIMGDAEKSAKMKAEMQRILKTTVGANLTSNEEPSPAR